MATERSTNPLPIVLHLVAIAVGLFLGIKAMAALSPDLPPESSNPGVDVAASNGQVPPGAPNSLFQPGPLSIALDAVDDQLAAGQQLSLVHITPADVTTNVTDGAGFDLSDVDSSAPTRLATLISAERSRVRGLQDFQFVDLRLDQDSEPQWYVQLALDIDPPRTYTAPLDALAVTPGG
ncbi:MAG: hypothetical protein ACJ75R_07515 [Solirubrobacterales bacterium]